MAAWQIAYSVHRTRSPTEDGSLNEYARRMADRFWPVYLSKGN